MIGQIGERLGQVGEMTDMIDEAIVVEMVEQNGDRIGETGPRSTTARKVCCRCAGGVADAGVANDVAPLGTGSMTSSTKRTMSSPRTTPTAA